MSSVDHSHAFDSLLTTQCLPPVGQTPPYMCQSSTGQRWGPPPWSPLCLCCYSSLPVCKHNTTSHRITENQTNFPHSFKYRGTVKPI